MVGGTNSFITYVKLTTITRDGSKVKMWGLFDYKEATEVRPYLSKILQSEYDCNEKQSRILYARAYAGNMTKGEEFTSGPVFEKWSIVQPGTVQESFWKIVCEK